jgi:hypothetical protein
MAFVSARVCFSRGQKLVLIPFLFTLPICLVAADQSAIGNVDSNAPQRKDFIKQFSAKDLLKQPSAGDLAKNPPNIFLTNPDAPVAKVFIDGTKQCSIPLLEAHVQRSFDTRGVIKIPSGRFDGMAAPNPAPSCKNWNEKGH